MIDLSTPLGTETQRSIARWAEETFGPASSNARVAARANEEMAELLRALTANDNHPKAAEEIADVVIVLCRLCDRLDRDLGADVTSKMAVNRSRIWTRDGSGHGYHQRAKQEIPE
jgi:NTP pyrophosphatase (non-canonical NTP hydrolase)